jgi:hypothetical protein
MINSHAEKLLANAKFSKNFCKPLYGSYCFSEIPGTVKKLLGLESASHLPAEAVGGSYEKYDLVLLFFIDGFGWRFFEKYAEKFPFLKRIYEQGICSKITSQFPSTTAAHVTCINTGLPVAETGIYEWFYYEPKLDTMIAPLLFSYAGDGKPETLRLAQVDPHEIYPKTTLYEELHHNKVASFVMQDLHIAHSTYSQMMLKGSKTLPFTHLPQALKNLLELKEEANEQPHYVYLYFGGIDSMAHRHGIDSEEFEKEVAYFWNQLEDNFFSKVKTSGKKIASLFIADHGIVPVDPHTTVYLNKALPELLPNIQKNQKGQLKAPAGSCRDFFLHIREEKLEETEKLLREFLKGNAEIYTTRELVKEGIFGNKEPSSLFWERVGNLVILPYVGEAIWWYEKNRFEQHFFAAHGGLSREEMETIFLFLEI